MARGSSFDVVVIGAGVFGAWTAWYLAKRRQRVLLLEMHGPAHSRASSGGESRIIRMSYGADEIYTRWSKNSLTEWKALFAEPRERLFHETGVLWLRAQGSAYLEQSRVSLQLCGVRDLLLGLCAPLHPGFQKSHTWFRMTAPWPENLPLMLW